MHCDWTGGVGTIEVLVGLAERLTVESTAVGSHYVQTPTLRLVWRYQFLGLRLNEVPESSTPP